MKILIIHNRWLEKGGEDEVVNAEAKLLKESGHQVILYVRSNSEIENFSIPKKLRFLIKDIIWSREVYEDIKALIRREKPDIAHLHNIFVLISASVYSALNEERVPSVQTLHNFRFFCLNGAFYRKGNLCESCITGNFIPAVVNKCWRNSYLGSYFFARALRSHFKKNTFKAKIDAYITLSKFSKNMFIKAGLPEDKIFIKPNFSDVSKKRSNKPEDFILFVGRLIDYKGIEVLTEVFNRLPGYKLKIIGDGPLYSQLKRQVRKAANIELLGRLPHNVTIEYIRKARLMIFPTQCYESMPRVVIESFACGVPVLASNVGGAIKELIEENVTGLLIADNNINELEAKIKYLMTNRELLESMGENCRRFYEEKFTSKKNYAMLIDIYNKVLSP